MDGPGEGGSGRDLEHNSTPLLSGEPDEAELLTIEGGADPTGCSFFDAVVNLSNTVVGAGVFAAQWLRYVAAYNLV